MKLHLNMHCVYLSFIAVLLPLVSINAAVAEQIVIDEHSEDRKVAGDFLCSPCYSPILSDAKSVDIAAKALTTGELYRYFQSRGITKINRLSFQVDVDCDPDNSRSVSLTDLSFQIQDASQNLVTHAGFGGSELLLDKSEITSFKPEAVLEVDLGYDFMQRFSPDSQEAVMLNFNSPDTSSEMKPRIILSSDMSSFSTGNFARIGGFVAFWSLVFFGAHMVTRQTEEKSAGEPKAAKLTATTSQTVSRQF